MVSPSENVGEPAVLSMLSLACWSATTVTLLGAESTAVVPKTAWPEAMFVIDPASRSAWVIVWPAVHTTWSRGARVAVTGQLTVTLSSETVNGPDRVTLPVLVNV